MSDETLQLLKKAALAGVEGIVIAGQVAESRAVAPGIDRTTNQPYDGYTSVRVVTGLGQSAQDIEYLHNRGQAGAWEIDVCNDPGYSLAGALRKAEDGTSPDCRQF